MRKFEHINGGAGLATAAAPPLQAGDKLTLDEFLRRWEQHPEIKFAELIGGIVYMPSPLSIQHGETEGDSGLWLGTYASQTPGVRHGHNATTLMGGESPQPDVFLRILPEYGGATWIVDNLLSGGPEFINEISVSSKSYDLHQKLELYERFHVQEYLAVLMHEQEIRWHRLGKNGYHLLEPDAKMIWKSIVFPGLWLDGKALLAGNSAKLLATLKRGLRSPAHAAFVKKLAKKKKK